MSKPMSAIKLMTINKMHRKHPSKTLLDVRVDVQANARYRNPDIGHMPNTEATGAKPPV